MLAKLNRLHNQQALRSSMEEGLKMQAMNRWVLGRRAHLLGRPACASPGQEFPATSWSPFPTRRKQNGACPTPHPCRAPGGASLDSPSDVLCCAQKSPLQVPQRGSSGEGGGCRALLFGGAASKEVYLGSQTWGAIAALLGAPKVSSGSPQPPLCLPSKTCPP